MITVLPVRHGELPAGAADTVAEVGGSVAVVGDGTFDAVAALYATAESPLVRLIRAELGSYAPARWANQLAPLLSEEDVVVLPAVPDGRDLAPRLAKALGRPLIAGACRLNRGGATVIRRGGAQLVELLVATPYVATFQMGTGQLQVLSPEREREFAEQAELFEPSETADLPPDAESLAVLEPDPASVDLSEAAKILAGGAGLGGEEEFALLHEVAEAIGASVGATRVVTDAGVLGHERQIGTTGVSVRPRLYVAFGISGAAQHVAGLGEPSHVIAVNLDASCPMMALADLAVVSDAPATLRVLAALLETHHKRADGAGE